jgi:lambda family phage tail tape measure protein
MAVIGSLSVKLGLVTVEWDQATKKAKQDAKDLQKAFDDLAGNIKTLYGHWKTLGGAMSLSAVGLASLMTQTLQFSDAISDLAKGFDLSVAKTLQFRDAIKSSGGNAEGASKMLSALFSKIEDARSGNEAAIAQFQKIGISFSELTKLSPEQALNRVFQAIANIGNTYERVKAVKEMLGKAGIGIEVEAVAQKLGMSTAQYDAYAKSIEKVGRVNDDLAATFDNMKIAFADMIAPFTREGIVSIEKFKAAMVALTTVAVLNGLIQLVTLSAKLIAVWREGVKVSAALQALGGAKGILQLGAATAAYLAAVKVFEGDAKKAAEAASAAPEVKPGTTGSEESSQRDAAARRELVAAQAKLDLAKQQIQFIRLEGQIRVDALTAEKYGIQIREANLALARELAAAENQRAQSLNKENLSDEQKLIIQQEYETAVAVANEKNRQAIRGINAEREISNRQELTVAQLRLDLANKQLLYIEQEGKLKIDALTTDRYTIQLQESGLAFAREKAQIENQRLQALNKENLTEQQRNIIDIDSQAALALATEKHIQNSKRIVAEREREIKLIQAQVEVAQRMEGFEEKRLDLEQNRVYMTDYAYKVALEELNTKQKVAELEQQIVDARTRLGAGAVFEAEKARIEDLIRSEQSLSRIRKDGLELEEYRRKSFKEGWEDAFRKFAQDSENYGKLGSDMFNSAISNMNSAIDNFVKTGKLNFKSFAQSVIQDILSMMLRFQAMQLVMAGMRSFGFAGAMPTGTVTVGPLGLPLPGKASGGFIDGPAIVGENGPELFIPSKSGTIIPNGRVSQALSQGPSVVYNGPYIANMSAIDTQSGVAFLARNKQAVWAANQSAQRSLPVSK